MRQPQCAQARDKDTPAKRLHALQIPTVLHQGYAVGFLFSALGACVLSYFCHQVILGALSSNLGPPS